MRQRHVGGSRRGERSTAEPGAAHTATDLRDPRAEGTFPEATGHLGTLLLKLLPPFGVGRGDEGATFTLPGDLRGPREGCGADRAAASLRT